MILDSDDCEDCDNCEDCEDDNKDAIAIFYVVGPFVTNTSGATWWPNLQPMEAVPPDGQVCTS